MHLLRVSSVLAAIMLFVGIAMGDAVVSVQPATITASPGNNFSASVMITNVADLYAFQFDIAFNPLVLSAASVSEGTFLSSGGTTQFFPGFIDNSGGTITFNADTLIGPIPGVTGGGTLAVVNFNDIGAGVSSVTASNMILLDSLGNTIPVGGQTPEPNTLILLGSGLVGLAGVMRRKLML